MTGLLHRELVFVTGKGGVGKTTVAVALALRLAAAGRRIVLVEVSGQDRVPRALGRPAGRPGDEVAVLDGIAWTAVDPARALEEWAGRVIGSRRVLAPALRSQMFHSFVDVAPGAKELITITKAWELGRRRGQRWDRRAEGYDTVIVDAPASGHGVGMLRTPRTFAEIARVGPIAGQSRRVAELLADPERAAIVAVSLPSEMPVQETLELGPRVEAAVGRGIDLVVCNAVLERRFSGAEIDALVRADGALPSPILAALATRAERAATQEEQVARLRAEVGTPVAVLPFLPRTALGLDDVRVLSERL